MCTFVYETILALSKCVFNVTLLIVTTTTGLIGGFGSVLFSTMGGTIGLMMGASIILSNYPEHLPTPYK